MFNKVVAGVIVGSLLVAGIGCSKKEAAPPTGQPGSQSELPAGHPSTGGQAASPENAKPVNAKEVADKVSQELDAKFPGDWKVTGTTLEKGSYTENNNYKIADAVAGLYNGSMVSIFVGQDRIASTITDQTGQRVLAGYPTPDTVAQVMESGEAVVTSADSLGSTSYQKVFLPFKADGKTVAVMSISIAQ